MFKYEEFILESQLQLISESIIYYSPKLKKVLNKIGDDIAKDLLELEFKDIKDDITFIDLSDREGYISFSTSKDVKKNLNIKYPESDYPHLYDLFDVPKERLAQNLWELENDTWIKSRNPLRIGRFINKVLPGKYNAKQLEDFSSKLKASLIKKGERFLLVKGDDIAKWYDKNTYYLSNEGSLGNSCMKSKPSVYFSIYTKNPEVCQMLCLIDEDEEGNDKLKARALVWKVAKKSKGDFEYFMDRQYAIDEGTTQKMRDYAKEQGWSYKTYNNHHNFGSITFGDDSFSCQLMIQLTKDDGTFQYGKYPYMDTFRRYDIVNGQLWNDDNRDSEYGGQYILEDTSGGYEEISDEDMVYSEWYDREIRRDEAVWSDALNDYLPEGRAVNIRIGNRRNQGWYPEDYDDITYDGWSEEPLHVDDSVYCEYYGYNIYVDNSIAVVHKIDKETGECNDDYYYVHVDDRDYVSYHDLKDYVWFQNIEKKTRYWVDHSGVMKSLLDKDDEGDWFIKKFKITLNKMKSPIDISKGDDVVTLEWIHEMDANLLDIEIEDETKISDAWTYTDDLKDVNLIDKLKKAIEKGINSKQLSLSFGEEFDKPEKDRISNLESRWKQLENFLVQ